MREIVFLKIPAFPIALERARDPSLRGRPVAVCQAGAGGQGLLQAVSAEARREGLFKGMPRRKALERCPGLRVVRPDPALYRRAAGALFGLLSNYSPLVEPARPGALFLDLTGTRRLFGPARDLAWKIRGEVLGRLGLEPRVGMATNKLLSRIAAKVLAGSSGLCDVFPGGESHFLGPLGVELLPAARPPERAERLRELNLRRVEDLLAVPVRALEVAFGSASVSLSLYRQARGLDASPVRPPRKVPQVTEEETLAEESNEDACLLAVLQGLSEGAGRRLRQMRVLARRMEIEVEYADDVRATGATRLVPPPDLDAPLVEAARGLFERVVRRRVRIRRIALHCADLMPVPRQLSLFGPEEIAGCWPGGETVCGWQEAVFRRSRRDALPRVRSGLEGCAPSRPSLGPHRGAFRSIHADSCATGTTERAPPQKGSERARQSVPLQPREAPLEGCAPSRPSFGLAGGCPLITGPENRRLPTCFAHGHDRACPSREENREATGERAPPAPGDTLGGTRSVASALVSWDGGLGPVDDAEAARRKRALQEALDEIRDRFGRAAIRTGGTNLGK